MAGQLLANNHMEGVGHIWRANPIDSVMEGVGHIWRANPIDSVESEPARGEE